MGDVIASYEPWLATDELSYVRGGSVCIVL
jgi:hypothetical protein